MSNDQRLIQEQIDLGKVVTQCCITEQVKSPSGYWVGFRFQYPYNKVSHTYCSDGYAIVRAEIEYDIQRYKQGE